MPLPVPYPEAVFDELRGVVPGYDLPLERLMLGEAMQTRLVGMWPDQIWDAGLVEPAQFTQVRLGTPSRYSQVAGSVIEREVPRYCWPQTSGLGSCL